MRILVTGGAGFIGSHVADAFLAAGHSVLVVDDLSTGRRENLPSAATFVEASIGDQGRLRQLFEEQQFDVVCHHAAQIDVRKSIEDPAYDASINIVAALRLLELCREFKVGKVTFSSTGGAIYGEPGSDRLPADESTPTAPISAYGVSKRCFEMYLKFYADLWGLDFTALRYANVYGPRQDPLGEAGVVAIFTDRLLSGKAPIIFGDGAQTRDYVYVGDVARANLLALKKGSREIVNIGTGVETDVNELLATLQRSLHTSVEPAFENSRPGEVFRIALDPRRASRVLGWLPQVSLQEGLDRTAEFYKCGRVG